ncbi:NuoM family protein [Schaalia sp. Marseille-Q2122]|uniref:complex I subunit 4 family protein n=1 Tax=Schaalia sp. Marseille-Q2122 TaxID=2736604 RepID=UPI0015882F81|nr:NADH-quinone oxidoreductase subunit M [Schaalia sp. Marseille-Q2122]
MEINTLIPATTPWLSILVVLPLLGALVLAIPGLRPQARVLAVGVSILELILAVFAAVTAFDWSKSGDYQMVESYSWIPPMGVSWALGVNALGLVMVLLAVALVPIVIGAAWRDEDEDPRGYLALILVLETFMVLIFAAFDVVLFYFAFEAMLIPLYLMIGRYGVGDIEARRRAAMKFLLFSLAGGLAMLGGMVALWAAIPEHSATFFRLDTLSGLSGNLPAGLQMGVFVSFMIAFAIKAPMVPVHTWLPDTAAVARPGTSVLLVGVLDKIGTFGMIALVLRLFPVASAQAALVLCVLAVVSILWGGFAAIGQNDIMRLVSYTSVSHFGFMVLGVFVGSSIAMTGAMVYMVAHGVSIAAMFLISGFLAERGGSRDMRDYVGMQRVTPILAGLWLVSGMASIALPGLSGFVPEYLVLMGTWSVSAGLAVFAVLGVVVAAVYVLLPYQRVFTGRPAGKSAKLEDLNGREKVVVAPLVAAMVILGVWAAPLVSSLTPIADEAATGLVAASLVATEGSAK